jgi:hypothetical protein
MKVNDTLANATRAAHDVGLAAWLGGAMFGKFAHNPSLRKITSHTERGSVSSAAWNGYNPINAAGLGAAALGWGAARLTEAHPEELTGTERTLSRVKDGLMVTAVVTGIASGTLGARLARRDAARGRGPPARRRRARHREHRHGCRARGHQRRARPDQSQPPRKATRAPAPRHEKRWQSTVARRRGRRRRRAHRRSAPPAHLEPSIPPQ